MRYYGGGNLYLDTTELSIKKVNEPVLEWPCDVGVKTVRCGLDEQKFLSLKPLLEIQTYISNVSIYSGVNFCRIDCHNNVPFLIHVLPGKPRDKNLCEFFMDFHGVPLAEIDRPWIEPDIYYENQDKIIVSRSFRYRNKDFPWSYICNTFRNQVFFIGDDCEYEDFCTHFGQVGRIETRDFLEVSRNLAKCKVFIGNQSSCYAIAEAMKISVIQETCPRVPDCVFKRSCAGHFISEGSEHNMSNFNKVLPEKIWP
jgi:hypothetical protein